MGDFTSPKLEIERNEKRQCTRCFSKLSASRYWTFDDQNKVVCKECLDYKKRILERHAERIRIKGDVEEDNDFRSKHGSFEHIRLPSMIE